MLVVPKSHVSAAEESPLDSVISVTEFSDLKRVMESAHRPLTLLGMELDVLPVNLYRKYESLFAGTTIKDCSPLIKEIRMVKSSYELNLIRQAARMNDAMFAQVPEILREGMTETEFAGQLEAFYRKNGHQGLIRVRNFNQEIFYGHIMSGSNLAVPSCSAGTNRRAWAEPLSSFWSRIQGHQEKRTCSGRLCGGGRRVHCGPGKNLFSW